MSFCVFAINEFEFEFIVFLINEFEFEFLGRRKNEFEFEFEFHQLPSMNLSLRLSFKILKFLICFLNTRLRLFRTA